MGIDVQYTALKKRVLLAGVLLLAAPVAIAQEADGKLFAKPSLLVAGVQDDNLFFSPEQPEEDRFLRVSPAIEGGYRSIPLTLRALYTVDVERYSNNNGLDSNQASERAALDFRYEPTRSLTFITDVDRIRTETPGELVPAAGLELQRVQAERFSVAPSLAYRFDRRSTGTVAYSFTRDEVVDDVDNETQTLGLGFDRQASRRDLWSLRYRVEQFDFETGETGTAHVLLGGGTHRFTRRTTLTVLAGPRFPDDDDSVEPEILARLGYELKRGELDLTYNRTEVAVLGLSGAAATESFGAAFTWSPGTAFRMRASSRYLSNEHDSLESDVTVMSLEAGYRITDYVTLVGSYGFSEQRGSLRTPGFGDIRRTVVLFGLVFAGPPERRGDDSPRGVRLPSVTFGGRL